MNPNELLYTDELLGTWVIRYPDPDGMMEANQAEILELKRDGTFSWNPTPSWAKPLGRWGITVDPDSEAVRLHIERRSGGSFRSAWLVQGAVRVNDRVETLFFWQRKEHCAVVFKDRILSGQRASPAAVAKTDADCERPSKGERQIQHIAGRRIDPDGVSELVSTMTITEIDALTNAEITALAMERPGHPGQYGFVLDPQHFRTRQHLADSMHALLKRLASTRQ